MMLPLWTLSTVRGPFLASRALAVQSERPGRYDGQQAVSYMGKGYGHSASVVRPAPHAPSICGLGVIS